MSILKKLYCITTINSDEVGLGLFYVNFKSGKDISFDNNLLSPLQNNYKINNYAEFYAEKCSKSGHLKPYDDFKNTALGLFVVIEGEDKNKSQSIISQYFGNDGVYEKLEMSETKSVESGRHYLKNNDIEVDICNSTKANIHHKFKNQVYAVIEYFLKGTSV